MLDLAAMNTRLYDIRLLDGTVLHLRRPTQAMVQYLVDMRDLHEHGGEDMQVLKSFTSFFARILNRNDEGRVFSDRDLCEEYDYQTILYVIQDYFGFWEREVEEEVPFRQAPQEA